MMFDTHAHITDELLENKAKLIIDNMKNDNLDKIVNVGFNLFNSKKNVELATKNANLFACVGIHPSEVQDFNDETLKEIEDLAKNEKVIGIGEIGIDYHYGDKNKNAQKDFFVKQIKLANNVNLPIVIHMRDCEEDMKQTLKENLNYLKNGVLFHCFCASLDFMNWAIKTIPNVCFAFGGACTYKNSNIPELIKNCPKNKLLTETDCPYLTPEPFRGKETNEPKFIKYTYAKIADCLNLTIVEIEQIVKENFFNFFKRAKQC